jgi:hypothetical protein
VTGRRPGAEAVRPCRSTRRGSQGACVGVGSAVRLIFSAALVVLMAPIAIACGGGSAGARSPEEGRAPSKPAAAAAEETAPDPGPASDETQSSAPRCNDETCFPCGAGFCLRGFYCDEGAKGGAACSWLPDCPKGATCDCLKRALRSCACETENGGAHVRCE